MNLSIYYLSTKKKRKSNVNFNHRFFFLVFFLHITQLIDQSNATTELALSLEERERVDNQCFVCSEHKRLLLLHRSSRSKIDV